MERPHVVYDSSTSTYVMYMHIDNSNYSERKAGVATSSSVCGAYTYRDSRYIWQPLKVSGTSASITCADSWTIDTETGVTG